MLLVIHNHSEIDNVCWYENYKDNQISMFVKW